MSGESLMIRSYIISALRSQWRYKGYAAINIGGLTIGIAISILILLWVVFESSFDSFHENADRIYRVAEETHRPDGYVRRRASSGTPLGPALMEELPSVEAATRLYRTDGLIRYQDHLFNEQALMFADADIFQVFSFPLLEGDRRTALKEPFTVVITEELAHKYFGDNDPIGKVLTFNNRRDFTVTGILAPIPANSHIRFSFLGSLSSFTGVSPEFANYWDSPVWNYVLLRPGSSPLELEKQLPALVRKLRGQAVASTIRLWLQPLRDIHLHSFLGGELEQKTAISTLHSYGALAILILFIACVNYINLATARGILRAREIGIRKVLGGSRASLIVQHLCESIVVAGIAALFSVVIIEILRPTFASLVGAPLSFRYLPKAILWPGFIAITVVVGLIAGIYPALRLTASTPIETLKAETTGGKRRAVLRRTLVVLQFSVATVLVICTMIGRGQLSFLVNKDLGFNQSDLVIVPLQSGAAHGKLDVIKNAFKRHQGVADITVASNVPGDPDCHGLTFRRPDGAGYMSVPVLWVDPDYARTLGLDVIEGNDLPSTSSTHPGGTVLVNQKAAEEFGFPNSVGRALLSFASDGDELTPMYQSIVVGIVRNFNFRDLSERLQPLVIIPDPARCEQMLVRLRPGSETFTLDSLKAEWAQLLPNEPFTYRFLNDFLASNYAGTQHFATVLEYASVLALLIACIGLFGLGSFLILQRTKEMGIRRVVGASSFTVLSLLTGEFLKSFALANLLAWPIAYWLMRRWLEGFRYRMEIGVGVFLLAGLGTLLIGLLAIGYQTLKAAHANPVDSLRYE
jgi:putative ABC transport system permease protein